ncbi:unnamed protein product [Eruca vesicaria subsp. sativa]|uniref:Uncharacterized protein n=1 Tax=Eruca vesicaria subsp. sativa TaxID=29727 RepID=A0ABC8JGI5_ERUVS|nr:unnamed protein product [Eruca vesicaria subsp. sativa]
MGTRIVSRSGKEKPCVSNELPQPIERKCLTVLGHETEVWIFPTEDTDSSLSETEEEEDDESDDGFPMKQFCGYNQLESPVFSDRDRDQPIQSGTKISVDSTNVKCLTRKSQILAQNSASVPHFNSIEKKFLTVLGHETDVWIFPDDSDSDSSLSEDDEDIYVIERSYIGTTPTNSAMGDLGAVPSNVHTSLASCIEEITKHVEFLKQELAKPIPSRDCLKWADLLFSWIPKTKALPNYSQLAGECWSQALSRGRAYYMAANKIDGKELTSEQLLDGVPKSHLMISGGIDRLENARDFMVENNYVKDMIVHRRPVDPVDFPGFEILLEKLLARAPVVVVFDVLPGYMDYDGKSIFTPDETECALASFERLKQHSVVVTGCGIGLVEGEPIEFWQTHDTRSSEWGVDGFGKLARRYGLMVAAVEFKF